MANDVFANNLEIACKAADGKSVACFPDVCFTPPSPPAGWIPIPYANTAYAKDTANASKTVFISGKPVMKKDVSYFKTSTGNEPAAGPQGIMTHVKKGKAYFTSWSMNVKIEGQNVDRHSDLTTHNHGSVPNTGPWVYADTAARNGACKQDIEKMDKACGQKDNKDTATPKKVIPKKGAPNFGTTQKSPENPSPPKDPPKERKTKEDFYWKREHCKGLTKSTSAVTEKDLKEITAEAKQKLEEMKVFEKILDQMLKEVERIALEKGTILAAKVVAKKAAQAGLAAAGAATGGATTIAAGVWFVYDIFDTASSIADIAAEVTKIKEAIVEAKKLGKVIGDLKKLANPPFDAVEASKVMADAQKYIALYDPCIRARKCQLVPYSKASSYARTLNSGCCKGQTGHHLVPKAFFTDVSECFGYNPAEAATVCAEGHTYSVGSHGNLHTALKRYGDNYKSGGTFSQATISYEDSIKAAVQSHKDAFPFNGCDEKCIKAQLENDRDKQCGKGKNPPLKYNPVAKATKVDDATVDKEEVET